MLIVRRGHGSFGCWVLEILPPRPGLGPRGGGGAQSTEEGTGRPKLGVSKLASKVGVYS